MPNVPIPEHPLIGATVLSRPDREDARDQPAREFVMRNWDELTILAVFHDWNGVEGLTVYYVDVPATGKRSHVSEAECGTYDLTARKKVLA